MDRLERRALISSAAVHAALLLSGWTLKQVHDEALEPPPPDAQQQTATNPESPRPPERLIAAPDSSTPVHAIPEFSPPPLPPLPALPNLHSGDQPSAGMPPIVPHALRAGGAVDNRGNHGTAAIDGRLPEVHSVDGPLAQLHAANSSVTAQDHLLDVINTSGSLVEILVGNEFQRLHRANRSFATQIMRRSVVLWVQVRDRGVVDDYGFEIGTGDPQVDAALLRALHQRGAFSLHNLPAGRYPFLVRLPQR